MKNKHRVVQISLDFVVEENCDGFEFADFIADELNKRGFTVIGSGFQDDVTEYYEEEGISYGPT